MCWGGASLPSADARRDEGGAGEVTVSALLQVVSVSLWGGMLVPIGEKPSSIADR